MRTCTQRRLPRALQKRLALGTGLVLNTGLGLHAGMGLSIAVRVIKTGTLHRYTQAISKYPQTHTFATLQAPMHVQQVVVLRAMPCPFLSACMLCTRASSSPTLPTGQLPCHAIFPVTHRTAATYLHGVCGTENLRALIIGNVLVLSVAIVPCTGLPCPRVCDCCRQARDRGGLAARVPAPFDPPPRDLP